MIMKNPTITHDTSKMDFDFIHGYLSRSYWSEGISKTRMKRAMESSINVGVFTDGNQVAYARVITDYATFAYLCDVFVIDAARGAGHSKTMMKYILDLPEIAGIKRFTLATKDAHGLYKQFGWAQLAQPEMYMEINKPGIYKMLRE